MSLVERALKKLQESRGAVPAAPVPGITPSTVTLPVTPPSGDVPRSTRVVHFDPAALRAAELLPPVEQERQLSHDFRNIKRPLLANAFGRSVPQVPMGRMIMMASALPGDGKTFTSVNLALSLALEKDVSVLLVDADVPKAHISRVFGIENEPGLLDVLRDEKLDIDSVILSTDVPGLSILSAGRESETATELLASARMHSVVAALDQRDPNRIVVLDSPPLLLTNESRVLATLAGQVVIVVRAGLTPQQAVLDAINFLPESKSLGLVLNQCDDVKHGGYARYYGQREAEAST